MSALRDVELRPVVLRVAVLVAGVLAWATVAVGRPTGAVPVVVLGLLVLSAHRPGGAVPALALLGLVVLQLRVGDLDARLAVTVVAVGAHHALCALVADLPDDAHVRLDALRRPLERFAVLLAGSLLLLAAALAVRGRVVPDAVLLAATGGLAVTALVVAFAVVRAQVPRRRR